MSPTVRSAYFSFTLLYCFLPPPPISTLFPYTTLFRSGDHVDHFLVRRRFVLARRTQRTVDGDIAGAGDEQRSEEHTSELQSRRDLVCRLLLEKKKYKVIAHVPDVTCDHWA